MSAAPGERVETETQHRPPVSSPHLLLTPPAHEKSPANPRRAKVPYSDPLSAAERLSSTGNYRDGPIWGEEAPPRSEPLFFQCATPRWDGFVPMPMVMMDCDGALAASHRARLALTHSRRGTRIASRVVTALLAALFG